MQVELGNELESEPFVIADLSPGCVERMISTGELARRAGVTQHKIRRWTAKGLIPVCRRPRENAIYPEWEAIEAVRRIIQNGMRRPDAE